MMNSCKTARYSVVTCSVSLALLVAGRGIELSCCHTPQIHFPPRISFWTWNQKKILEKNKAIKQMKVEVRHHDEKD